MYFFRMLYIYIKGYFISNEDADWLGGFLCLQPSTFNWSIFLDRLHEFLHKVNWPFCNIKNNKCPHKKFSIMTKTNKFLHKKNTMYAGKIILHILLSAVLFNRTPHCSSKLSLTFVTALPIPGFLRIHYLFDLILNCVFLFFIYLFWNNCLSFKNLIKFCV